MPSSSSQSRARRSQTEGAALHVAECTPHRRGQPRARTAFHARAPGRPRTRVLLHVVKAARPVHDDLNTLPRLKRARHNVHALAGAADDLHHRRAINLGTARGRGSERGEGSARDRRATEELIGRAALRNAPKAHRAEVVRLPSALRKEHCRFERFKRARTVSPIPTAAHGHVQGRLRAPVSSRTTSKS